MKPMLWSQYYAPIGDSLGFSALVAAIPVATGLVSLAFRHSIALATLMGILVMLQAYVFKKKIVATPNVAP